MVSFIIRMRFAPEDRADMLDAARKLAVESRKEPGCITYIPAQPEDDAETLMVVEQYADEKALTAHRDSDHFKKWCVGVLFQKMKDRAIENLTPVQ